VSRVRAVEAREKAKRQQADKQENREHSASFDNGHPLDQVRFELIFIIERDQAPKPFQQLPRP
jgi:hypothetical protein